MKTNLELKKPLVFIKVQTTGLNPKKDRIIQACFSKLMPDGTEQEGTKLINPGIEIPADATEINGITDEMVKDKPGFDQIAEGLNNFLKDCDFAGFNIRDFELKFLIEEFNRAGISFNLVGRNVVDLMSIYRSMFPRNFKEAVHTYLEEEIKEDIVPSTHFVKYSRDLMEAMLIKHNGQEINGKKITSNVEELHDIFSLGKGRKALDNSGYVVLNADKRPIFTTGKYNGHLVSEALLNDKEYFHWLVEKSDFPSDTKTIIKKIVQKAKDASKVETAKKD